MENTLINQDFASAIKRMRSVLPVLSFSLLIGTYLISAIIMGIFHAQSSTDIAFKIAAFLVPLAIQTGRGTLVFFFQLNPFRIQTRYSFGVIAATALLILSLCEAVLVMYQYGLSWTVSVATLMVIGWIIEIMILRETMFATQLEIFQNLEQWQQLKNFYAARNEIEQFITNSHNNQTQSKLKIGNTTFPNQEGVDTSNDPNSQNLQLGNVFSPSLNGH